MKQILLLLLVWTMILPGSANAQTEQYYHKFSPVHHNHSLNNPITESTGYSGTGANIDVIYHKIYWRINPDSTKYIKGWVQTNFRTIQANVTAISFDIRSILNIDSVVFRNTKLPTTSITRTGNIVNINLGVTLPNAFIDSLVIFYQGVPPGVAGAAQGYQVGSNAGAGNYVSTLSESYEDRDWWPCKADMQDKIDSMDIIVNVPWGSPTVADTFWVACNGKMVDSTIIGSNRNFVFKNRNPIASYLVFVSVARFDRFYNTVNVNGTDVPVVYNLLKGKSTTTLNNALIAMDKMNPVVVAFSNKFGEYPFKYEKHGYYDGLMGAGGMEHQTFSGMATSALTSLRTLGHELAHQWFGDNVTFATWNDLWLAEGFAQYAEALQGELVPILGINPYSVRSSIKSSALASTVSAWIPNSNIVNSDMIWNTGYGGAVYVRGAMIVSMLRAIAGDQLFYQALTNYQTQLKGKSATADSLKNHFNAVLGRDITVFFNDYVGGSGNGTTAVGGKGYPINTVTWNSPSPNKLLVQATSQTQSSVANVSYFRGPVVLHIKGALANNDTTITYFDWGNGNLSFAGNGLSAPIAGGMLNYTLSFTPTSVAYDDSARTMSQGSTIYDPNLFQGGFTFGSPSPVSANCPIPTYLDIPLTTASVGGYSGAVSLSAVSGVPQGASISFLPSATIIPGNTVTVRLNSVNNLAPGTYTITVQGSASGAATKIVNLTYIVSPSGVPQITAQPTSQNVCNNNSVSFSVGALGAGEYMWQVSTDGGINWANTGATIPTLTISNVTASMNGYKYRVVLTSGCGSTTSDAATLSVYQQPVITQQPVDAQVCEMGSTTFSVTTANGQNLQYQWQMSAGSGYGNIGGANSPTLAINNAPYSANGNKYRVVVTTAGCAEPIYSTDAILTVRKKPVVQLAAQSPTQLLPGQTTLLTATVSGAPGSAQAYTWLYNNAPFTHTGNTYPVYIGNTGTYSVKVTESWGSGITCQAASSAITITALESEQLFIFPNPNDGKFSVAYINKDQTATSRYLRITDAKGAVIYNRKIDISGLLYTITEVDIHYPSTGIYFLQLFSADGKKLKTAKVMIR